MLYKQETREINNNYNNVREIKLKSSAKAFKIIFGTIYKDIIKAIVREIFTNAWDSQKKAGTLDKFIEIHAPTKFEPYFSVRDYGTGMTDEIVNEVYSVVFESSKDENNDEAGFMGMGSKTPLGYVDSFTVVSYVDGKYAAYEIFLNEEGAPVICDVDRGSTDEENGVLISLSVKNDDMDSFAENIKTIIFPSTANVAIDGKKVENDMEILYRNQYGYLYKSDVITGMQIKMGCVLYKIDMSIIESGHHNIYGKNVNIYGKNVSLVIDSDIGDFDVTGSRDDVVYNRESKARINEILTNFYTMFLTKIQDDINKLKTKIHVLNYDYIVSKETIITAMQHVKMKTLKWRSRDIHVNDTFISKLRFKNGKNIRGNYKFNLVKISSYTNTNTVISNRIKDNKIYTNTNDNNVIIFANDDIKSINNKVRHIIVDEMKNKRHLNNRYILLTGKSYKTFEFALLQHRLNAKRVILMKDYPKSFFIEKKENKSNGEKYNVSHVYLSLTGLATYKSNETLSKKKKYYYLDFKNGKCVHDIGRDDFKMICRFYNLDSNRIISLGKSHAYLKEQFTLINLYDRYITDINKINFSVDSVDDLTYKSLKAKYGLYKTTFNFASEYLNINVEKSNITKYKNVIMRLLNTDNPLNKKIEEKSMQVKEIISSPLMDLINHRDRYSTDMMKELVDFVKEKELL